jgi:hypothetical protein
MAATQRRRIPKTQKSKARRLKALKGPPKMHRKSVRARVSQMAGVRSRRRRSR